MDKSNESRQRFPNFWMSDHNCAMLQHCSHARHSKSWSKVINRIYLCVGRRWKVGRSVKIQYFVNHLADFEMETLLHETLQIEEQKQIGPDQNSESEP